MKLANKFSIDYRSVTAIHLPEKGINGIEMLLPGASSCTVASSSCSCGAVKK